MKISVSRVQKFGKFWNLVHFPFGGVSSEDPGQIAFPKVSKFFTFCSVKFRARTQKIRVIFKNVGSHFSRSVRPFFISKLPEEKMRSALRELFCQTRIFCGRAAPYFFLWLRENDLEFWLFSFLIFSSCFTIVVRLNLRNCILRFFLNFLEIFLLRHFCFFRNLRNALFSSEWSVCFSCKVYVQANFAQKPPAGHKWAERPLLKL